MDMWPCVGSEGGFHPSLLENKHSVHHSKSEMRSKMHTPVRHKKSGTKTV